MKTGFMKQRLLASTIVAGTAMIATPVFAQSQSQDATVVGSGPTTQSAPIAPATSNPTTTTTQASSADGQTQAESGGEVTVTGSRIPHPDLTSASPVAVIGAPEVKQTGTTRVEDLLNALPQVFAGQGGNLANGATGTATVDLRGLGASRTLVLVNGRRLVPGDPRSPVADINIIPAALIKRVDVLTGGASSVYGADAVSGVVNFVMDTEFNGFKLDGQYSLFNHNNNGSAITSALNARGFGYPDGVAADGGTLDTTAVIGAGFDDGRGHVTAYAGYRRIEAITQDQRDYSACTVSALSAAAATTAGRPYQCGGSGTSAAGTFYTNTGTYNVQGSQFVAGRQLYNYAPTNYFQRPDERYTAGFFAHEDVSDAFKPYLEFMFMDDRTVAQIAPSGDFYNTTTINCDNPLLSAQQLSIACANGNLVGQSVTKGVITGTPTVFTDANGNSFTRGQLYIGRRNVEGGGRQDDLQHTTYRGVIGARGDIAKGISYDAYYQYSRVNFAETYRNDFSVSRLTRALDVVNVNGVATCRSVVDGSDPNCVPYNVFTTGGVSQAALNYLQTPGFSRGQTTEQIANASVTFLGSEYGVASPFANEGLGLNVGAEYRKESLNFETDEEFSTGDLAGQGGATIGVSGSFSVKEAFAEASLPLIQDRPFFQNLSLGAGYRRSHYDTNGNGVSNSFDTDTYKFEGQWAPVRDIKFRASYNHAVRAPNAVELFSAQSVALDGSIDPCAGTAPTYTAAQCALTGVTAAQYGTIRANPSAQYNGLQGGNPNLTPEVANSVTAGVVLTPSFLRGFQATVDYFNIKLKNQIGVLGADTIITQCLATGDPSYCSLIHRNAAGSLYLTPDGYITDTNLNAGRISTKGIDVTVGYTQELGQIGALGFSVAGTWLDSLITDPVGSVKYNCVKLYGTQCGTPNPEWRHKARLTYTTIEGPSVSVAWRYFSAVHADTTSSDVDLAGTTLPGNARIGSQSYFDLALTVPVADKFTMHMGANNLLDRKPPINGLGLGVVESGNTFPQVYDALGRYLYVGVTLDL